MTSTLYFSNSHSISKGCTLLLMGSADKLPEKPKEQVKFVEDLPESEAAAVRANILLTMSSIM